MDIIKRLRELFEVYVTEVTLTKSKKEFVSLCVTLAENTQIILMALEEVERYISNLESELKDYRDHDY